MTDYTDDQLDAALESLGAKPLQECTFPVELEEAFYLCVKGGLSLRDYIWKVKQATIAAAVTQYPTKAEAAGALSIQPITLWRIENEHHK